MRNTFAVLALVSVMVLLVALSACSTTRSSDSSDDDNSLTGEAGRYMKMKIGGDTFASAEGDAKRNCLNRCKKSGLDSATCNEKCKDDWS